MIEIEKLKFDEKGLIPAIVVDAITKRVLTLAYMNRESLRISMEKELTCFFSRSRQELWLEVVPRWQAGPSGSTITTSASASQSAVMDTMC